MPKYEGFVVKQRDNETALRLFMFATTAQQILGWAEILRTKDVPGAAQRMNNETHIRTIQSFMTASDQNVIPTAVSIALKPGMFQLQIGESTDNADPSCRVFRGQLTIESRDDAAKPGVVIDGQHRLLAFNELPEEPPLLACAILGADELERALQFIVINNKAKRVSTDLVKGIASELPVGERDELRRRLTKIGMTLGDFGVALSVLDSSETSPFQGRLSWEVNREGVHRVQPRGLESALRALLAELRTPTELDVDDAILVLSAIWRGVRDSWNVAEPNWDDEESKLIQKAGLVAVTEFLIERINMKVEDGFDTSDLVAIESFCKTVMSTIPSRFWLSQWNEKQLDTSAGRSLIRQSLSAIRTASAAGADDPLADAVLIRGGEA